MAQVFAQKLRNGHLRPIFPGQLAQLSELGVAFLLFMIGLEIDLKKIKDILIDSCSTTATVRTNTLTVSKALTPASDSGLFIMNANGTPGAPGGNGATASAVTRVGNLVTFAESAGAGTSLAQYQSSYSCARTDTAAVIASGAGTAGSSAATALAATVARRWSRARPCSASSR